MTDEQLRVGIAEGAHVWSSHAIEEAEHDRLRAREVDSALAAGVRILRRYPEDRQGESALALAHLADGRALHAVIGYGRRPWTIVTVYLPDPGQWNADFTERRR